MEGQLTSPSDHEPGAPQTAPIAFFTLGSEDASHIQVRRPDPEAKANSRRREVQAFRKPIHLGTTPYQAKFGLYDQGFEIVHKNYYASPYVRRVAGLM